LDLEASRVKELLDVGWTRDAVRSNTHSAIREWPPQGGLVRRHVFVLVLLVSSVAHAQAAGTLTGLVRTSDGQVVAHLALTVNGPGGSQTVVIDPDGRYRATGLAPGDYTLSLQSAGFVLSPEPPVSLGDSVATLDLSLFPAPVREHVVVTATRTEAAQSTLGVTVSALDEERIDERQASASLELLQDLPGVATARTGGIGSQASAFVRGGESRFARILVDGVAVNEPGGAFDFGNALPLELGRVEVVRGAASSLYGTDALAGVVQVLTRRAAPGERPSLRLEADGGSFDWRRFAGATSGTSGRLDWNLGLVRLDTDNQEPNNAFGETAGAAVLGVRLGEASRLGFVVRAASSEVGTPGQTAFGRPDLDASTERDDLATTAQLRLSRGSFVHAFQAGYTRAKQLSFDPVDSGPFVPSYGGVTGFPIDDFTNAAGFQNLTSRLSFSYQAETQLARRHLLTAGADLEHESGALGSRAEDLLEPSRTNFGVYVQDRLMLWDRLDLTVGARGERNANFGTRVVPRAALALRLGGTKDPTIFRASAGLGIKEPSFFESYGVSFFAKGNPDLEPERSRTVDAGVEQRLFDNRLRVQLTGFYHDYRDQITFTILDFSTFEGTYTNLERTRAKGIEVEVEGRPRRWLQLLASYTYLDGKILESGRDFNPIYAEGEPLLRRPANQASFTAFAGDERFGFGATLVVVGERADSDFVGLGLTRNPGYERLDLRGRVRLFRGLEAYVVGENVLDETYQEVLGYPALGVSVRGGLRYRAGRR
jgi:vitamin B12 transporter